MSESRGAFVPPSCGRPVPPYDEHSTDVAADMERVTQAWRESGEPSFYRYLLTRQDTPSGIETKVTIIPLHGPEQRHWWVIGAINRLTAWVDRLNERVMDWARDRGIDVDDR